MLRVLSWISALLPEPKKKIPSLVPEVDPIMHTEGAESAIMALCPKADTNHPQFIPFPDLDLHHLPERWRQQHVLQDIRDIALRVVKLRVSKRSPDRLKNINALDGPAKRRLLHGHHGTGFVTYDSHWGIRVHTSKHVVLDPYEAQHTDIIFFCDSEGEGVKCRGSTNHFRSVWSMDYSSFTLEQPLPEEVERCMQKGREKTFAWRLFALKRLLYRQSRDVDVVIISHPHGTTKKVSFGKMSRPSYMSVALYTAVTCPGSSGAPVIRLSDDYRHYVAAGQFVHHGYNEIDQETATAIGSLRPPVTLPYHRLLDVGRVRQMVALLYEPVSYWSLYFTDFLEVEGILFNCTDNFCYFLTLYGYFCSWQDPWTLRAFWGLVCILLFQQVLFGLRGIRVAVFHTVSVLYRYSMHWVTWLACFFVSSQHQHWWWVIPLWLGTLIVSRQVSLPRLLGMDIFEEMVKCRL